MSNNGFALSFVGKKLFDSYYSLQIEIEENSYNLFKKIKKISNVLLVSFEQLKDPKFEIDSSVNLSIFTNKVFNNTKCDKWKYKLFIELISNDYFANNFNKIITNWKDIDKQMENIITHKRNSYILNMLFIR